MKVTMRPATKLPQIIIHRKVAAYCRVSTQQEIQHHSLEAQCEYYEKRITSNPGWEFVGIYADEASGRNNRKMRDFQKMMDDCRKVYQPPGQEHTSVPECLRRTEATECGCVF